jgi:hypothetical protein
LPSLNSRPPKRIGLLGIVNAAGLHQPDRCGDVLVVICAKPTSASRRRAGRSCRSSGPQHDHPGNHCPGRAHARLPLAPWRRDHAVGRRVTIPTKYTGKSERWSSKYAVLAAGKLSVLGACQLLGIMFDDLHGLARCVRRLWPRWTARHSSEHHRQQYTIVALFLYFVPAIIALDRKLLNPGSIFIVNLFLGWTLTGWVGALAWAPREQRKPNPRRLEQLNRIRVISHLPTGELQTGDTVAAPPRCG